jgi:hypothetical protein
VDSVTAAHPELGYRIACRVRDSLFALVLLPVVVILLGPFLYELGL